jgi:glycosyltransferase involved in cell wall biosynthesis
MNEKLPISCFIIAQDEADRIGKTIQSVKELVDEIIVIDSGSTDGTQKAAEEMGCKVFFNKWNGFGPQKRFGEDCSKNKWLLNLDADEYISPELSGEIRNLFANNMNDNFYSMKVIPIYPNWNKPRLFSAHHLCVRLYNIEHGRFSDSKVHDSVETNFKKIIALKNPVFHKSVRSFKHLVEKENNYIKMQALSLKKNNRAFLFFRLIIEFPLAFIKYYFIRRHITGYLTGFFTALILAYFRWKRIMLFLKLNKYKS